MLVVQNDQVEDLGLYESTLRELGEVDVVHAYLPGATLPGRSSYDAYIIGPTPIPANEAEKHPFLAQELHYLSKLIGDGKPVLGVCCGGQMLARLLGGEVVRSPIKEIGEYSVQLTDSGKRDPLFMGFPPSFPVFQWHTDMFTIPPGGEQLVSGYPCPVQAFAKGPVKGIIFHLEVSHLDAARWADAYPMELAAIGKTRAQVVEGCRSKEKEMGRLAELLINNFTDQAS